MNFRTRISEKLAPVGRLVEEKPAHCLAFFLVFFCFFYAFKLDHRGVGGGDELGFIRGAYHLVHSGVMSDDANRENPVPTARRAPGYSLFLAAGIQLVPDLLNHDFECVFEFKKGVAQEPEALVWLKRMQAVLLLATALMTAWLVLEFTGKRVPAYLTLWFIGFHPFLGRYVNRLYAETFGAFLITLFSVALYLGLKRKSIFHLAMSGFILGYLTLTFSQWKLVGFVTIPSIALYILLTKEHWKKLVVGLIVMTTLWVAMFSYWEKRNEGLAGYKFLSAGGGTVLQVRSLYDTMPWSAYWSSFAYWSRAPLLKKALITFVDKEHYVALVRHDEDSVYQHARARREFLAKKHDLKGENGLLELNNLLMVEAKQRILENPVRHLLTSIPIAYRTMMNPTFSVLYIGVYFLFMFAVYKTIRNKEWLLAVLLASPFALFGFNWLVTHGLPRYSEQATPLLVLGAVMGCNYMMKRVGD